MAVFCIFFIRRHVIEYHLDHTFGVSDPEFFGSALALSDPVPLTGNKIELLQDGDAYFPAMLAAIRGAKKTINFQAYIVDSDKIGWAFRDALIERARAGVEVRVLLDGLGSGWSLNNSDVKMMKEAGCKFAYYHPLLSWRDRSHQSPLASARPRRGRQSRLHRRDRFRRTMVGPRAGPETLARRAGAGRRSARQRVAERLRGTLDQDFRRNAERRGSISRARTAGEIRAQVIASHSFSMAPVPLTQAIAFAAAEKRIWITNAYCTPSDDQVELLVKAVQRGVDVRFIVPGAHNDQPLTKSAGRAAYGRMLEGGVKIFEYQPTMIHTKAMVIDGMFSLFGSSNLDPRSSEINEELDLAIYDREFGSRMEAMFESDLKHSTRIHAPAIQESLALGTYDRGSDAAVSLAALMLEGRPLWRPCFRIEGQAGRACLPGLPSRKTEHARNNPCTPTRARGQPDRRPSNLQHALAFPAHRPRWRFRRHPDRFVNR